MLRNKGFTLTSIKLSPKSFINKNAPYLLLVYRRGQKTIEPPKFCNMRIMIFVDLLNFELTCKSINPHLMLDYYKIPTFILSYVIKKYNWQYFNPQLIRAYAYGGEYTNALIEQLERLYGGNSEEYKKYVKNAQRQKQIENWFSNFDFFELKLKPLGLRDGLPRQKGVDVQMAVDLVSHAYQNNYDIAIICSGDADLLESMNLVKSLGKRVIVVSKVGLGKEDRTNLASAMKKDADAIIDINKFTEEDFKQFTHLYKPKIEPP